MDGNRRCRFRGMLWHRVAGCHHDSAVTVVGGGRRPPARAMAHHRGAMVRMSVLLGSCLPCGLYAGCMSIEAMAPPVGMEFASIARDQGVSLSTLETGRQIYLSDCSRCHSIEPIARYSKDRWHTILPRMIKQSRLEGERGDALTSYVFTARDVLATRPHPGGG